MKHIKNITLVIAAALLLSTFALAQDTIDQAAAENIALEAAGVAREEASRLSTERENERGQAVFEVEFGFGDLEYEYCIDASDASIIKQSWELTDAGARTLAAQQDANADAVDDAQALETALENAALTQEQVTNILIKSDSDEGLRLIEVNFRVGDTEYEYGIDAVSGEVLERSIEPADND